MLSAALWPVAAFLLSSIPFGWLAARLHGINIREVGSGNIGGANVWRALGWRWGLSVLAADALKGLLPTAGVMWWLAHSQAASAIAPSWHEPLVMLSGAAAVLGHTFTPWLGFRGGKGVATGLGVMLALYQAWALVPLAAFAVTLGLFRMVSLGSIVAALTLAAISVAVPSLRPLWPFGLLAALLVLYTHRGNIARLIAGTEPRIGMRKSSSS